MKHDKLRSIAHNVAQSLASGASVMVGVYDVDVFAEAGASPTGILTVDFLNGLVLDGQPSMRLTEAVGLFGEILPAFCNTHGGSISDFREFKARYHASPKRFVVTIEDQMGKRSSTEYVGRDGERIRATDELGRVRKKPLGKPEAD